jgi:FKBP-type peptidyl-prolyl cis-trans isomerase (trigger factor)
MEEIRNTLKIEKRRTELNKFVEDLVAKIKDSFEVVIPKTLIDQEIKQRIETLKQRYGGAENFEKMLKSMKPEEVKKFYEDLSKAAKESISNFLVLMKYADIKKLTDKIDYKKDLDLEEKLLSLFKKKEDKKSK